MRRRRLSRYDYDFETRGCNQRSRSSRAADGAALGFFVGLVTGALMGGAARFVLGKDSKQPLLIGLSMLGIGTVGGAIVEAIPPEC